MNKLLMSAAIAASLGLAGCGTLSNVDSAGKTDDPVFPSPDKVSLKTGTYPDVDHVRLVEKSVALDGMTRDQLYELLGRPHFSEVFRSREWDYLFHFHTAEGLKTCQYKLLFDKNWIARSTYWAPQECAQLLDPQAKPQPEKFSLSGDVGFEFDSAVLTAAGVTAIRDVAQSLKQASQIELIDVSGHTDRLGSDAYNLQLSRERAAAVRRALIAEGLPAERIRAQGYGKAQPVVQCDEQARSALIACLAPNRRVDIQVQARR